VTSKEGTADFADFADKGDAAQGGQSRWLGDTTILAAMLSRSFLSVSSAPSAVKSTTGNQGPGGTGPYPIPPPPSQPKTFWDETSQPPSRPSIASELETSRRRGLPSRPRTSWDETSQPLPTPSITSGVETSRLHTSHALATQNFLGRDVPAPIQPLNYFGTGDVPSPNLPRPHNARHSSGLPLPFPDPSSKP